MDSQFDPNKNAANIKKHGVSMAEGDGVLDDAMVITIEDKSSNDEARYVSIGANLKGELMVVVWTDRNEDIRYISVRRATRTERRHYEERI